MSVELPRLEQLLADAAERHYGPRRARVRLPRLRVAIGVAVAAAAVVLAVVFLPLPTDERAAGPRRDPADAVADHFSVFAHGQAPNAAAMAIADNQRRALDPRKSVEARLLKRFPGGGIVALAGASRQGEPSVCLTEMHRGGGGGGCITLANLLRERGPWFTFGVPGQTDDAVTALVPDNIAAMRMRLKSGATRPVPVTDNLAYARAGETVCEVTWTTADGHSGRERALFEQPPLRC
jgi:hypothetical protein